MRSLYTGGGGGVNNYFDPAPAPVLASGGRMPGPTAIDLAWTAGFMEGEGSFLWTPLTLRTGHASGQSVVIAVQVQREPLDRLRRLYGGYLYVQSRPPGSRHQSIWKWGLTGHRGIGLMMSLYGLMSPKRRAQIAVVLNHWRALPGPWNRQRAATHCRNGHPYTYKTTVYPRVDRPSERRCRLCERAWKRAQYHKDPARHIAAREARRQRARLRVAAPAG